MLFSFDRVIWPCYKYSKTHWFKLIYGWDGQYKIGKIPNYRFFSKITVLLLSGSYTTREEAECFTGSERWGWFVFSPGEASRLGRGVAGKRGAIGFLSLCLSTCALGGKERQFIAGTGARLGLPFVVFRTWDKILSPWSCFRMCRVRVTTPTL